MPKKGCPAPPLDYSREMKADPRDVRMAKTQWPCYGKHTEGRPGSNKWGQWVHCSVCSLRLSYIPREGAPGHTTKVENSKTILRSMAQLKLDLHEKTPTAEHVHAAIEYQYAKDRYLQAIHVSHMDHGTNPVTETPIPKAGMAAGSGDTMSAGYLGNPNATEMEDGLVGKPILTPRRGPASPDSWSEVPSSPDRQ